MIVFETCWALSFWLEVVQGRLQSQFWSNMSCAGHKGVGQWRNQRNKKLLRKETTQHLQVKTSYNRTRTRKYVESKAKISQSTYMYEMNIIVKELGVVAWLLGFSIERIEGIYRVKVL
jgi:hypothetical protein